jgi:hypothetical protein
MEQLLEDIPCKVPSEDHLYRKYRLTPAQWIAMGVRQGWICPVCNKAFKANQTPVVDEDHDPPYEIRGLLHHGCNQRVTATLVRYIRNPPARQAIGSYVVPETCRKHHAKVREDRKEQRKRNPRRPTARSKRTEVPVKPTDPRVAALLEQIE